MHKQQQEEARSTDKEGRSLREVFSQKYPVDHGSKSDQINVRSNRHKAAENLATKDNALTPDTSQTLLLSGPTISQCVQLAPL